QSISKALIDANQLTYRAPTNANGPSLASLTFKVQDDALTTGGGKDTSLTDNTLTFTVQPVNDRPVGADFNVIAPQGSSKTFALSEFTLTDPNDQNPPTNNPNDPNTLLAVRIESLPDKGTLTFVGGPNGGQVGIGQFIPATAINAGNFLYTPIAGQSSNPPGAIYTT